ncbi:uncharacterized protein FA14DRAFT_192781 [Meira miltonrushii]|uniref:Uncharacterized protein n=1 Tax=Meira miltonrushii TaxID=1280837 RepID=A0A316V3X9_9BASI|nr:uncharacterized protein FA14DRAFT_192781 [Meira miltonrushii]PWN31708.1 hypothetical protein FA14DRAFT_192781 [Meira miltonrushii]
MFRTACSRLLTSRPNVHISAQISSSIQPRHLSRSLIDCHHSRVALLKHHNKGAQHYAFLRDSARKYSTPTGPHCKVNLDDEKELERELKREFDRDFERQESLSFLTMQQKKWQLPESEAKPPKVIRPILFFVGIGAISILAAACWTVKKTGDMVENAEKLELLFPMFHQVYPLAPTGSKEASWGRFNEEELRFLVHANERFQTFLTRAKRRLWYNKMNILEAYQDALEMILSYSSSIYLALRDEQKAAIPILAVTTALFFTFKAGKTEI